MTDSILRSRDASGSRAYSDRGLPDHTGTERWKTGQGGGSEEEQRASYDFAKSAIKEAQKRIPKLYDYWQYLSYLRSHNPLQFERVMNQLKREDPQAWLKLQKHPQFQPLFRTSLGFKTADKQVAAAIGIVTGKYTGSMEKWLETVVQADMKRQRWGEHADVLGAKASTLAAPAAPTYSKSRLGQWLQAADADLKAAWARVSASGESSKAAVRTNRAASVTRVGNVLLELGIGALDTDVFRGISAIRATALGKELLRHGILMPGEELELRAHMARGEFDKARELIAAGVRRAEQAEREGR